MNQNRSRIPVASTKDGNPIKQVAQEETQQGGLTVASRTLSSANVQHPNKLRQPAHSAFSKLFLSTQHDPQYVFTLFCFTFR